jgi:acyl-CoA synthetase (AMP-forming)/AMP-acid ligase II
MGDWPVRPIEPIWEMALPARGPAAAAPAPPVPIPWDPARTAECFTSGTGEPKGVVLTHGNLA